MSAERPTVFVSYRREETAGHAGRLYDELAERLGAPNVFMDVDLAPGIDFVERITTAVDGCRALLVVMGPRWATGTGADGRPRIADPDDFVRLEVETALRSSAVTVIPVLVAGARMPPPEQLPESLRPLARRNAIELSDQRWRYDVGRLLDALGDLLGLGPGGELRAGARAPVASPATRVTAARIAEGTLVAAGAGAVALLLARDLNSADTTSAISKMATTTVRNALIWAVVGLVLAGWLSWRVGDRRRLAERAVAGLLLGALGGALGGALFAVVRFAPDTPPVDGVLQAVSIGSLALAGAGVGVALGSATRPSRRSAALAAGLAAGALAQLLLVALDQPAKPNDALRSGAAAFAALQAASIAVAALAALRSAADAR